MNHIFTSFRDLVARMQSSSDLGLCQGHDRCPDLSQTYYCARSGEKIDPDLHTVIWIKSPTLSPAPACNVIGRSIRSKPDAMTAYDVSGRSLWRYPSSTGIVNMIPVMALYLRDENGRLTHPITGERLKKDETVVYSPLERWQKSREESLRSVLKARLSLKGIEVGPHSEFVHLMGSGKLIGSSFKESVFNNCSDLKASLEWTSFQCCQFQRMDFEKGGTKFDNSIMRDCMFDDCRFDGAILDGAIFSDCHFKDVTFSKSSLNWARFFSCRFENVKILEPRGEEVEMKDCRVFKDGVFRKVSNEFLNLDLQVMDLEQCADSSQDVESLTFREPLPRLFLDPHV